MNTRELLTRLREKFFERLDEKTGWGKEKVKQLYDMCAAEVAYEQFEKTGDGR